MFKFDTSGLRDFEYYELVVRAKGRSMDLCLSDGKKKKKESSNPNDYNIYLRTISYVYYNAFELK